MPITQKLNVSYEQKLLSLKIQDGVNFIVGLVFTSLLLKCLLTNKH